MKKQSRVQRFLMIYAAICTSVLLFVLYSFEQRLEQRSGREEQVSSFTYQFELTDMFSIDLTVNQVDNFGIWSVMLACQITSGE